MLPSDTVIILGIKIKENGEPDEVLKSRLERGIEVFKTTQPVKLILSGSSVHNQFVEAEVMADYCRKRGIPGDVMPSL